MAAYKSERQRRLQEEREADERIRTAVRVVIAVNKLTMQRMANLLGISRATLYCKMKKPTAFTEGELRVIRRMGGEYSEALANCCGGLAVGGRC